MKTLKNIYAKFCVFEQWLAVALLGGITLLVFVSALTRTFGYPINWAQDAALVMFAWLVFIGGDIALHSTGLIGIDLLVKHFPKAVQKTIDILFKVIMLVFLVYLVKYGYDYVLQYAKRMINTLNISYSAVTAAVPTGSFLMIISVLINLVKSIRTPAAKWGEEKFQKEAGADV